MPETTDALPFDFDTYRFALSDKSSQWNCLSILESNLFEECLTEDGWISGYLISPQCINFEVPWTYSSSSSLSRLDFPHHYPGDYLYFGQNTSHSAQSSWARNTSSSLSKLSFCFRILKGLTLLFSFVGSIISSSSSLCFSSSYKLTMILSLLWASSFIYWSFLSISTLSFSS